MNQNARMEEVRIAKNFPKYIYPSFLRLTRWPVIQCVSFDFLTIQLSLFFLGNKFREYLWPFCSSSDTTLVLWQPFTTCGYHQICQGHSPFVKDRVQLCDHSHIVMLPPS